MRISPRVLAWFWMLTVAMAARAADYDVVVYGGTSAGVIAAVQAKRMGKSVIVVGPDKHLGGLSSGGLGFTDTGNKAVIGGLAREFYHRVWQHYDDPAAWTWQKKSEYGNKGQGTPAVDGAQRTMWIFEPHVAEGVFEDLVRENAIPVARDEWLDRARGVQREGAHVVSITMLSGKTYAGKMFIDATYEGDLMAAAGVSYHVGREANSVYGETLNGVQVGVLHHRHHFGVLAEKLSPYVVPGDPSSGVLPRVSPAPPGDFGEGDRRVQAYCYRLCLTDRPENRVPFTQPEGYDPKQYELLLRVFQAGWREGFNKFDPIPNRKTDVNNHGPFSTDDIGFNYDYPEASYERRREILREHETYEKGWFYFVTHDPRMPADLRAQMSQWGLAKDEFADNGNWPHQIYVREARRMIGAYVMTENDLLRRRATPDSVGMGSYGIDSHNVQRYITSDGAVQNEGDIGVPTPGPYAIAYGALVPAPGQADNLLVPVCVSSSHIAFGSIRMEPVFMILGQSAATAAALAIDDRLAVQDVPYAKLKARLVADGQVLSYAKTPAEKKSADFRSHSHNDYEQARPLATALASNMGSVEADVWLVAGELRLGHSLQETRAGWTLRRDYLDPLKARLAANGGRVYREAPPLVLLIDIKSDAGPTYAAIARELAADASCFTHFTATETKPGAITVVISGAIPRAEIAASAERLAAVDGRPADLETNPPASLVPLISDNWKNLFQWDGRGEMPADQREKLRALADRCHRQGRKLRLWNAPDNAAAWREQFDAGVDYLNTDLPAALHAFLQQRAAE